jgi:glycosyltransferase involved in cell wall biosynthesis
MITYNHETYIKQAIDSILMQHCSFSVELVIGEDCSTDNTLEICSELAKSNPCIRLISNNSNQGMMQNFVRTLNTCSGKYIALCEGDDYWIDPYKLQKQVNFMEGHSEVSLCFTNSRILYDKTNEFNKWPVYLTTRYYESQEIMFDLVIPTCSVVIRNQIDDIIINRLLKKKYIMGDLILWLSMAENGKLFCINEQMVVYRKNQTSFAFNLPLEKQIQLIHQHEEIAEDFNFKYKVLEKKFLSRQYMVIGLKCLLAFDRRALHFIKLSCLTQPRRIPKNIFYLIKRIFITDRKV